MDVKDVRKEVGSSMLVGLSCENIKQAKLIDRDIGAKNSAFDLVASTFLTAGSAILILGLSDKLYI